MSIAWDSNPELINRRGFLKRSAAGALACGLALTPRKAFGGPEDLGELLAPIREQFGIPSLAAVFASPKGLIGIGAVGRRRNDWEEPTVLTDDLFHIGSNTKSMTATVLATLVEEGVLGWETTLADVYPELVGTMQPDYEGVTLLDLCSHRSGIRDLAAFHNRAWTLKGPITEQRYTMVDMVLGVAPEVPPGSTYMYSNWGYILAGAMAEQLTGVAWEDLIAERLFAPLGMTSAYFGAPGSAKKVDQPWGHSGSGYTPIPPGRFADNPPVYGPAGTVHCSLTDFAVYGALHTRGEYGEKGLLLTPESFAILHTDWYSQGYALGWLVAKRSWAGGRALTHSGSNTYWYHNAWLAPARGAILIAATNGGYNGFQATDAVIAAMIRRYLS